MKLYILIQQLLRRKFVQYFVLEIANIDIKKQYTIFYGEFRYCLILHFDKKTTSFFLPNDCFKWFLAGNNDKITCIHDGKAAFILFSECL